jgi:glyoxylase-like metal-dependent hydrolase (beta-lactamase superfamily II)
VGRALVDGEAIDLAGVRADVFAVPGHTAGSAAYLVGGVLFMGDAAEVTSDGHLTTPRRLFTANPGLARASLVKLGQRLAPRADEVQAIACAHSGLLPGGLGPLLAFGR